jgi:hypothetical protein
VRSFIADRSVKQVTLVRDEWLAAAEEKRKMAAPPPPLFLKKRLDVIEKTGLS